MIPFNIPPYVGTELGFVEQAAAANRKISGDGMFTKLCSEWLEERFGARKMLLTTSGTTALEMAAILCDLNPGDEVIFAKLYVFHYRHCICIGGGEAGVCRRTFRHDVH